MDFTLKRTTFVLLVTIKKYNMKKVINDEMIRGLLPKKEKAVVVQFCKEYGLTTSKVIRKAVRILMEDTPKCKTCGYPLNMDKIEAGNPVDVVACKQGHKTYFETGTTQIAVFTKA